MNNVDRSSKIKISIPNKPKGDKYNVDEEIDKIVECVSSFLDIFKTH